jgi:hypothetical protein
MLPKDIDKKYDKFLQTTQASGIIDPKTSVMLSLASAMAIGCYP